MAGVDGDQNGPNLYEDHMALVDFVRFAREAIRKAHQFAVSGRGNPIELKHFEQILKIMRIHGYVSTYAASGLARSEDKTGLYRILWRGGCQLVWKGVKRELKESQRVISLPSCLKKTSVTKVDNLRH